MAASMICLSLTVGKEINVHLEGKGIGEDDDDVDDDNNDDDDDCLK